ncbi:MAG: D-alanyl-D-alanine carboxypeptidase [Candidatus Moranbacteria bacterium]|nr:D-alanyl-D-alanine carboxypeptidase [Candidatus Moranbacteria bacterium]
MRTFLFLFGFLAFLGLSFFVFHKTFGSTRTTVSLVQKQTPEEGRVEGTTDSHESKMPISFESRAAAAQILPIKKPSVGDLYVAGAHASVVLDADSGMVLHEEDSHEKRQIASLTKLMTAMIVVERIKNLDEAVTIPEEAVYAEGTRVGCPRSGYCIGNRLKVGEQVSVRNLLKAALMNSANDAAISLGMHMGGTQAGFADIMNKRADELGLKNTHFCTPSGLEIDGRESECYSSAYDIARITANSLQYDVLWEIMRLPNTTITSIDGTQSHDIFNTDALLDQYPNLLGTKTGFTPLAGYSLLAVATDATNKHRVVSVVLDDSQRWQDIQHMFAWAFSSFVWK